jgi:WD40 repeat protein
MKKTFSLLGLLFLMSALVLWPVHAAPGFARSTPGNLDVISPKNVKDIRFLTSIGQGVYSGAFDLQPEGDLIAAVTASGIALLNRNSGEQNGFIAIGFQATALAISPDGQTLAVVYNVPTGKTVNNSTSGLIGPEYERLIDLYSFPDGKQKKQHINNLQECGQSNIWQIAFTPDGNSLIFEKKYGEAKAQRLFCVLSIFTGKISRTFAIPANAVSTLSPDGKYIAIAQLNKDDQADKAAIYDTQTLQPRVAISFHPVTWPEISFTRKGIFVVSSFEAGVETSPYTMFFWSLPEGKPLLTLREQERYTLAGSDGQEPDRYDRIMAVDISPDGKKAVTGSQNGKIKLWDVKTGQMEKELDRISWNSTNLVMNSGGAPSSEINSYVGSIAFSSDGQTLVAAEQLTTSGQSGQIHVYHLQDGQEAADFYGARTGDAGQGIAFSPDSRQIAFGGFADGSAEVHQVPDGALLYRLIGHSAPVNQAQYSRDGAWIATASDDRTIRLWEAANGKTIRVLKGHDGRVTQVAFSPDSKWLVSGADDGTIRRWKLENGNLMNTQSLGNENWRIETLTVLADRRSVVYVATKYPSPLVGFVTKQAIWDVESGKEVPIGNSKTTITSIGTDGKTFVGYGDGGVVGTLDVNGKMKLIARTIRSPFGNGALGNLAVSPDSRLLISGNGMGLQAWELTKTNASFLGLIAVGEPTPAYGDTCVISPDGKTLAFTSSGVVYLMGVPQP